MKLRSLYLLLITSFIFSTLQADLTIYVQNGAVDWKIPFEIYTTLANGKTSAPIKILAGATIQFPLKSQGVTASTAFVIKPSIKEEHIITYPINWEKNTLGKYPLKGAPCVYQIRMVKGGEREVDYVLPAEETHYAPKLEFICNEKK